MSRASEMVLRVAMVLDPTLFLVPMGSEHSPATPHYLAQESLIQRVKDAIGAMREPTDAMIDKGLQAAHSTEAVWQAMIDEALK